jgi:hypothetical protein
VLVVDARRSVGAGFEGRGGRGGGGGRRSWPVRIEEFIVKNDSLEYWMNRIYYYIPGID